MSWLMELAIQEYVDYCERHYKDELAELNHKEPTTGEQTHE